MQRVFALDVMRCPSCAEGRRILAMIAEARIRATLMSLHLPSEAPVLPAVRGPPEQWQGA